MLAGYLRVAMCQNVPSLPTVIAHADLLSACHEGAVSISVTGRPSPCAAPALLAWRQCGAFVRQQDPRLRRRPFLKETCLPRDRTTPTPGRSPMHWNQAAPHGATDLAAAAAFRSSRPRSFAATRRCLAFSFREEVPLDDPDLIDDD